MKMHFYRSRSDWRRMRFSGNGTTFLSVMPLAFCLAFIWPFGGGKTVHMMAGSQTPAARGDVQIKTGDNGNTEVDVQAHALASPSSLTPAENAYVLWIQPPDQPAQNEGQLSVGQHEDGELRVKSPFKRFSIFITAEQNATVQTPQGPKVLSAQVSHD